MNINRLLRNGLLSAIATLGFCASAQAQSLDAIFTQQATGAIIAVNPNTGNSSTIYTASGDYWNAAAYNPNNGLVYIDSVGGATFTTGVPVTNTIYSFNALNPSAGVTEIGTVTGQAAFSGAGFYNGQYYVIAAGSNQLESFNLTGLSGSGALTASSTQTLGGLGSNVTGLSLGDIEFIGNSLYISGYGVGSGAPATAYTLYKYADVSNTTTPTYAVSEGSETGVGLAYYNNTLLVFNSDGTLDSINPTTGAETPYGINTLQGPAAGGGAGDFTVANSITVVPEPKDYAIWFLLFVLGLVTVERKLSWGAKLRRFSRAA
jgi:hypothetical protein